MVRNITSLLALVAVLSCGFSVSAQPFKVLKDDDWCRREQDWDDDGDRYCEVREFTLDPRDMLRVDAEPNGGISVQGWDKKEILIRAKVSAHAKSAEAAQEIAREVSISTNRVIKADGPNTHRREWFSVSYEIFTPKKSSIDLTTQNGGVEIRDLDGRVRFETLNGGVELADLSGDVVGRTTNGGVSIDLKGKKWDGRGLDVETVNGGVKIRVPENYSAELETGTVNGHIDVNFPVLIEGRFDRRLTATIGDGGKLIRAVTTNGGVVVTRG